MLGLKLNHVSKRHPWWETTWHLRPLREAVFIERFQSSSHFVSQVEEHHKRAEESHKSGLFGFMRRNSWGEKEGSKMKSRLRMSSQPSSQQQQPRPPKGRGRDPDGKLDWCDRGYWPLVASYIDGLVQESCNSRVLAIELRLSCTHHRYIPSRNLVMAFGASGQHWFR